MRWKRVIIKAFQWIAAGGILLILLLALLFGLLQTRSGKRKLLDWIVSRAVKGPEIGMEAGELRGLVPFDMSLDTLIIRDKYGELINLDGLRLHWSPMALFHKKIHIRTLEATAVLINRLPPSLKKEETQRKRWPEWPPHIPPFLIERVYIGKLALGQSMIGQKAVFTIDGRMHTPDETGGITASMRIERLDGARGLAEIALSIRDKAPVILLRVMAEEAEGGIISHVLGLKTAGPISIDLQGKGPIHNWQGELKTKADLLGSVEGKIVLSVREKPRLSLEGRLRTFLSTPLGHELGFDLDLGYENQGEIVFYRAAFRPDGIELQVKGRMNLQTEMVNAGFDIRIDEVSPLAGHLNLKGSGRLTTHGNISGQIRQPDIDLSLELKGAIFSDIRASNLALSAQMAFPGPFSPDFPGIILKGRGEVEGFIYPDQRIIPLTGFKWVFAGEVSPRALIHISRLDISGQDILLRVSGNLNPGAQQFEGDAAAEIKDLKGFSALWGKEISGEALLQSRLTVDGKGRSASGEIHGHLRNPGPLPSGIKDLVLSEVNYRGRVLLKDGRHLDISDLSLETHQARLSGNASFDILTKESKARCRVLMPDLGLFSPIVKNPLKGALQLDLDMGGPLTDPRVHTQAMVTHLLIRGIKIEQWKTAMDIREVPSNPKGHISTTLRQGDDFLKVEGDFSLKGKQLALSDLSIDAPGTCAGGDLNINMDPLTLQGILSGECSDLSRLSNLWKEEIKGNAVFDVRLSEETTGQSVLLDLKVRDLETRFGDAADWALNAHITDVFRAAKGKADVTVRDFHKERLQIDALSFSSEGEFKKAAFSLSVKGLYDYTFDIRSQGSFHLSSEGQYLHLDQMQGIFADYPLGINRPLNIRHTADGYILEPVELNLGEGSLHAASRFSSKDLMLDASFQDIPLEMFRLLGYPDLLGSAKGDIRVAGEPDRPDGTISLSVSDFRLKRPGAHKIDTAHLAGKAVLKEGLLQAGLSVEGLSTRPITANLLAPMDFSLSPFSLSMPAHGEIQGQIRAETDLSVIPEILLLEDQIIEGLMDMALFVTGTVGAPVLEGSLRISGGAYENTNIGTIIKDIQIRIKGEGETLVLEEARATDGQKGSISARGWLRLVSLRDFNSQVDLLLNDAVLLRHFDLTANTNGHLSLSAEPKAFSLKGNLRIGPAEVHIPDRLPPEVTEIEVIEINREGEETKPEEKSGPDLFGKLKLDLSLDFPGRIFVRGRGLDSEWRGSLQIAGNARDPLITGALSVIRGHFNMFGKRFLLTNGAITFDGKVPPLPGIDVTAENRRSDLTARIHFSGNLSALSLTLESDPMLPQDEILAMVLFGRSISETTPIQALRLAQALNTLRGRSGVLDFMGRTRRFIGLDQLDIRPPEGSGGETTVSIGKYLAEGVFVEMEKGVDTESSKVSVEVELTPNITIESESGSNSEGGVGLNWKWDY